jgi:hypothetical protein
MPQMILLILNHAVVKVRSMDLTRGRNIPLVLAKNPISMQLISKCSKTIVRNFRTKKVQRPILIY